MKVADYLIKKLEELGVNDFFGVPGDYNFKLLYAIENNLKSNWIGCTNELNAGYAADGYARVRGYGALVTTYGVGELSAVNAVAGSMAENVPVVHIVGLPSSKHIEKKDCLHHNFQEPNYYNCFEIYKKVTVDSAFLAKDDAKFEIDRVLKTLVKEKKPVYIAIPSDVADVEIYDKDISYEWPSDDETLDLVADKIAEKINDSSNPVILGDVLIKRFDANIEYREFVAKSKIPATNFFMGTNLISYDYENYLGGYFSKLENKNAEKAINTTDCLIAVGTIYSDLNSYGFNIPYKINNHIAIYGTYVYLEGKKYENVKMSDLLDALIDKVKPREDKIISSFKGYSPTKVERKSLSSEYIYPRLQEFFKENDIVIADTGIVQSGLALIKYPANLNLMTQTLWGSIGWATPATMGACIAKPNSRIILITGEGAHQTTAMEIGSMLRYGLKPIVIVLNNGGYTIERVLADEKEHNFNDIVEINYSKFARIFEGNIWSTKVTTDDDFDKALKVTQIMNKMCYIEIATDSMDLPNLTKNMVEYFKSKEDNKKKDESNRELSITEKLDNFYEKVEQEDFTFETVVHKGFTEE